MSVDAVFILALQQVSGVGNVLTNRIAGLCERLDIALSDLAGSDESHVLEQLGHEYLKEARALSSITANQITRIQVIVDRVCEAGGYFIAVSDADYPDALKQMLGQNTPPLLTFSGNQDLLQETGAAVVGARNAPQAALDVARACAETFAQRGIPVISGGARGVDHKAHIIAASESSGSTIIILPQGLLTYRLPDPLVTAWEDGRVLLVSSFFPDADWSTQGALSRNEMICAFSRLVCVIEPAETGGTVRTARSALGFGRKTLCFSCDPDNKTVSGLLKDGAQPLIDGSGAWDADRLMELWETCPAGSPGQIDLF